MVDPENQQRRQQQKILQLIYDFEESVRDDSIIDEKKNKTRATEICVHIDYCDYFSNRDDRKIEVFYI